MYLTRYTWYHRWKDTLLQHSPCRAQRLITSLLAPHTHALRKRWLRRWFLRRRVLDSLRKCRLVRLLGSLVGHVARDREVNGILDGVSHIDPFIESEVASNELLYPLVCVILQLQSAGADVKQGVSIDSFDRIDHSQGGRHGHGLGIHKSQRHYVARVFGTLP